MPDKISIIRKSLKIRLYPSEDQKILLNKTFGCCRLLYNERLREHLDWYNINKDLPKDQRSKFKGKLPKQLREEKYEFLSEVIAEPLINSQRNCEEAFSNFFKSISGKRKGRKVGFPKFKAKKDHKDSFALYMIKKEGLIDFNSRTIFIPKLKDTKFRIANSSLKLKWMDMLTATTIQHLIINLTDN